MTDAHTDDRRLGHLATPTADLITDAFDIAIVSGRHQLLHGVIAHSDVTSQCVSVTYAQRLNDIHALCSSARSCYACAVQSPVVKLHQIHLAIRRGLNGLTFAEGRAAVRSGVLPTLEHQAILRALQPSLVVDVGANRGQFSLDVRRAVPSAQVIAFEPLGPEADIYASIFPNAATHSLHRVALGAVDGSASLHVSAARDRSSLLPIGDRQREVFPGTEEVSIEVVEVRTLDDFIDEFRSGHPALLKIDVQGAELDVVRGGPESLRLFRWIYLEMSFIELYDGQPLADALIEELRTRGFELCGVSSPSISGGVPVQVDALFERR